MSGLWLASYILLWVVVVAMGLLLVSVLRNLGVVYSMVGSLPEFTATRPPKPSTLTAGAKLPDAQLITTTGESKSISEFAGSRMAFAIVSSSCGSCLLFLQQLNGDDGIDPADQSLRDVVIIGLGDAEETRRLLERAGIDGKTPVMFDVHDEIARKWGIATTPATVVMDEEMRVVRQYFGAHELMALREAHANGQGAVARNLSVGHRGQEVVDRDSRS
jgi:hypothetical protein